MFFWTTADKSWRESAIFREIIFLSRSLDFYRRIKADSVIVKPQSAQYFAFRGAGAKNYQFKSFCLTHFRKFLRVNV
jgi:hypothetical protein